MPALQHGFDSIIDAIAEAVVITDSRGDIVFVNRRTERLLGFARGSLLGRSVDLLVPLSARGQHAERHREFIAAPRLRPMGKGEQLHVRREDGTELAVDITLSPVKIAGEQYVISTIHDVSARVRTEARRFRAVFEQKHQLAGIVEVDGTLSDINDCALDYSGLRREDVIGRPFDQTGWWVHDAGLQARLRDAIRSAIHGETVSFDATHPRPGGGLGLVDFSLRPVRDENGKVAFLVPESQDITERRVAEDSRDALHRAVELAEQATAMKSRFLAAASHDLRQPLQSLSIYLSVLERKLDDDDLGDITHKMRQSLDVMGELLGSLLDVSRFDSGSVVPRPRSFRLQEILDRVAADNAPQAAEKQLTLDVPGTDLSVQSDPGLLERIVENLVANAIAYTESGSVSLRCVSDGAAVRISVTDTGIGISRDDLDLIFEEYFQLDNPVRQRGKGLGLGLSIVRQIARLLDHPIEARSTPGVGSTFTVTVPLASRVTPAPSTDHAKDGSPKGGALVLLVDDDPAVLDATSLLLGAEGCDVRVAASGFEALELLGDNLLPDVLITDYRLPDIDGLEVVRRGREAVGNQVPAIVITGDTAAPAISRARVAKLEVLQKPVSTDRLLKLVHQAGAHRLNAASNVWPCAEDSRVKQGRGAGEAV